MSYEEIKVGDVCEIVGADCACTRCLALVGLECTIVGAEQQRRRFRYDFVLAIVETVIAFGVTVKGTEGVLGIQRQYLRKRPPKQDSSQWIRQQSMQKADFDKWLDGVREGEETPAPAEV